MGRHRRRVEQELDVRKVGVGAALEKRHDAAGQVGCDAFAAIVGFGQRAQDAVDPHPGVKLAGAAACP
jgi:hypothetical protein